MSSAASISLANPVHLVLGDSATGCLRAACASCAMPGTVVGFSGDFAHEPIDADSSALLSQWHALIARLNPQQKDAVIVWSGDNIADAIFVRMVCDRLAGRADLFSVRVPGIDMCPFVAMHSPEQIARLYATRQPLSTTDRLSMAQDFARIRDTCGPVRRLVQGRVVGVPIHFYDPLLLEACDSDWRAAAHVVGTAMAHCDARNLSGDGFFRARLDFLIDAGRIEALGSRTALSGCSVRLAKHA